MKQAWMLAAALLVAGAAHADDPEAEAFAIKQYVGWRGLMLYCPTFADNPVASKIICDSVTAQFNFLAELASIPHSVSAGETYMQMIQRSYKEKLSEPLILQVEITTTKTGSRPNAIEVRLSGQKFYSEAVEQSATSGPTSLPKGGDLY